MRQGPTPPGDFGVELSCGNGRSDGLELDRPAGSGTDRPQRHGLDHERASDREAEGRTDPQGFDLDGDDQQERGGPEEPDEQPAKDVQRAGESFQPMREQREDRDVTGNVATTPLVWAPSSGATPVSPKPGRCRSPREPAGPT